MFLIVLQLLKINKTLKKLKMYLKKKKQKIAQTPY